MIKILIVDDNSVRAEKTKEIIIEQKIPETNVKLVDCVLTAKESLLASVYDLMILDLALPTRSCEGPKNDAGAELLYELAAIPKYKIPAKVIVISEYDDAIQRLSTVEDKFSFQLIKYEASSDEWSRKLRNYLEQFLRVQAENVEYNYDIAIICALSDPELWEIRKLPFNWYEHTEPGDSTQYYVGEYNTKRMICASSYEMGMSAAAVLATKIIMKFRPRYLIMTGIAGGVDKTKYNLGDVIIADPCFDYGSGKRVSIDGKSGFKPDYRQMRLNDSINTLLRNIAAQTDILSEIKNRCEYTKPGNDLQVNIAPFGSGAAVVTDLNLIDEVTNHNRKFTAFDMEAYGVMLAGYISDEPKPITVVMKSISDFGEGKDDCYQKYASYTSAKICEVMIKELFKA